MSPEEAKFSVRNPKVREGTVYYEVRGFDSKGDWQGQRRYKEFDALRDTLSKRFPGMPIPFLPEKAVIGNKETPFLKDRRFYLERFLQKLLRFPTLLDSEEF